MYQFVLGSGVCPPFALCTQPDEYLPISTSNIKQYQGSLLHIVCQDRMEESTAMAALEVFSDPPLDVCIIMWAYRSLGNPNNIYSIGYWRL